MFSRKRTTVIILVVLGLLFTAAMFGAERFLRDDDPTPTIEAASGAPEGGDPVSSPVAGGDSVIVPDSELSARCWPNGGPVPGNEDAAASPPSMALDENTTYSAIVTTNYGSFTVEFYPDDAPNTVNNFVCLANEGYYDGTIFHRVIDGFMFQGGDPLGTGTGGPGYRFADEPIVRDYVTGTLAMANAGPDTQGSQFFVVLDNLTELQRLPKNYTIFGQVTDGMDVVQAIGKVEVGMSPSGELSSPTSPVQLVSVEIIATPKG
jgi:cyclophilin family peptidyl-prolyl cis-trans isomerase